MLDYNKEYLKKYRLENKEKIKQYRESIKDKMKQYYIDNKARILEKQKERKLKERMQKKTTTI
jgi:hypothetical protein